MKVINGEGAGGGKSGKKMVGVLGLTACLTLGIY